MCTGLEIAVGAILTGTALGVTRDIIAGNAEEDAQRRQAEIDRQNAKLAEEEAMLAGRRTEAKVAKVKEAGVRLMSKQVVTLAGNNLDVSTGSAAEILEGTAGTVGEEVAVVRYNGIAEAYGYRMAGKQYSSQAAAHEAAVDDAELAKWLSVGADVMGGAAKIAALTIKPGKSGGWDEEKYGPPPPWGG